MEDTGTEKVASAYIVEQVYMETFDTTILLYCFFSVPDCLRDGTVMLYNTEPTTKIYYFYFF